MSEVLYRKYRPQTFQAVHGQDTIVKTLIAGLRSSQPPHAYIFVGPRGTGKTTLARLVARATSCEKFQDLEDVCNTCSACLNSLNNASPDIIEIDAASNRGIDEIRSLKDSVQFMPTERKRKVYIIDEVHMLTKEAFNALLKTLEEPPAHVVFVMATTEAHKIPITVLSRLQRFDLRLASPDQLGAKLKLVAEAENVAVDEDALALILERAEGSYRDAESLLGKIIAGTQPGTLLTEEMILSQLGGVSSKLVEQLTTAIQTKDRQTALELVHTAAADGADLLQLAKQLANHLRKQLVNGSLATTRYNLDMLAQIVKLQLDSKTFEDVGLLWDLFLLTIPTNESEDSAQPAAQAADPSKANRRVSDNLPSKKAAANNVTENMLVKERTSRVSQDINTQASDLATNLLTSLRQEDFRLWTLLKGCQTMITSDNLILQTAFQYNYEMLQKPDNISKLQSVLSKLGSSLSIDVKFEQTTNLTSAVEEEKEIEAQPTQIDNSEVVEALL